MFLRIMSIFSTMWLMFWSYWLLPMCLLLLYRIVFVCVGLCLNVYECVFVCVIVFVCVWLCLCVYNCVWGCMIIFECVCYCVWVCWIEFVCDGLRLCVCLCFSMHDCGFIFSVAHVLLPLCCYMGDIWTLQLGFLCLNEPQCLCRHINHHHHVFP